MAGQVIIEASTLFGGLSGSAVAEATAVGGLMIPQMKARGHDADYAVKVTVMASLIAIIFAGVFTATESSCVAVLCAVVITDFACRELD